MNSDTNVSIVICTWNRMDLLDGALQSFSDLAVPKDLRWELLVINNNSTDGTDEVIEKHSQRLPIRRLFEPKQGKSNAANLAIDEARGELIIWTDDDALVSPNWLTEYWKASRRWFDADYFGGPARMIFPDGLPHWLSPMLERLSNLYLRPYLPKEECYFPKGDFPFGVNMATRKRALSSIRFDPRIGPSGDSLINGEEVQLLSAISDRGAKGVWVPSAELAHVYPASRLTRSYIWRSSIAGGRRDAFFARQNAQSVRPRDILRRFYRVAKIPLLALSCISSFLIGGPWIIKFGQLGHLVGLVWPKKHSRTAWIL